MYWCQSNQSNPIQFNLDVSFPTGPWVVNCKGFFLKHFTILALFCRPRAKARAKPKPEQSRLANLDEHLHLCWLGTESQCGWISYFRTDLSHFKCGGLTQESFLNRLWTVNSVYLEYENVLTKLTNDLKVLCTGKTFTDPWIAQWSPRSFPAEIWGKPLWWPFGGCKKDTGRKRWQETINKQPARWSWNSTVILLWVLCWS